MKYLLSVVAKGIPSATVADGPDEVTVDVIRGWEKKMDELAARPEGTYRVAGFQALASK